ncbi:hypothetical protein O181_083677 [Austropuccinia psidii MF-1]|uniref:Uncharacterized protein n=1 Tax=Austropuccinia psidii MF-1 TaxID=1389203 RepID=A0A9Q3FUV5_9BASI|nr:hypothetical protein [Austropuccinia psidii MF-1]
MDFCTCPKCRKYTSMDANGISRQGLMVHRSTQTRHWAQISSESCETTVLEMFPHLSFQQKENKSSKEKKNDTHINMSSQNQRMSLEIISFVSYFIIWLYLSCGLSKSDCQKVRDMIVHIIQLVLGQKYSNNSVSESIPCDLQTIEKHFKLTFPMERYVCCPTCYSLYDIEVAPDECHFKASCKDALCGTDLFCQSRFKPFPCIQFETTGKVGSSNPCEQGQIRFSGQPPLRIPHTSFISQSLHTWIEWLINVPGIENEIDDWASLLSGKSNIIIDVSQANVWKKMFNNDRSPGSLDLWFCLFVDWFNPRGNWISGKKVSMGVISLNCLNLPPWLQFQQYHTCIAGLIPAPNQPNMLTTNNVLRPLVDELLKLNEGIKIITPKYPHGRKVFVRLVSLIGDIVATHKVSGFMSHSARKFCSWCDINHDEQGECKLGNLCHGNQVLTLSWRWKSTESKASREQLAKKQAYNGLSSIGYHIGIQFNVFHSV